MTDGVVVISLVAVVVFTIASAAQAVTGFGSALIAVPLLALVVDPVAAVVSMTVLSLGLTSLGAVRERAHIDRRAVVFFGLTGLIGMPLGLLALRVLSASHLTLLMALVLAVLIVLLAARVRIPSGRGAQWLTGISSGALLTSTGMNGPPLVVTLQAMGMPPRPFRATLQGVFIVQDVLGVVGFVLVGSVDRTALWLAATGVVGIPVGWWLGDHAFRRMSAETFRRVVLIGLAVTAVVAAVRALS